MAQDNDQRNVYMSVDFGGIPTALRDTTLSGYIVKRGQNFKTERRRYFVLEGGLLKYYNKHVKATGRGDGLKGQVGLCGMSIIRTDEVDSRDGCRWYTLKSPVEKDGRWLKFENDDLAEEWIKALQSAIYGTNHDALVRLPRTDIPAEVVEWYYWMEASFLELARELDTERAFNMTYNLEGYAHVSSVMLSLSADSMGLLMRFDSKGKRMNEMEFRNDGRVVLFQSIRKMECIYAETKKQGGRKMSSMKVTLQTEEDTLTLESTFSLDEIEQWVTVVRECVMFCIIPAPTGTAGAGAVGSTSAARNDFRSMSGLVFGADVDVEYLIKAVLVDGAVRPEIFPSIAKLCQQVGDIFNRVRDVNCNKDAFGAFSRRLADLLRVMLDPQAGGLLLSVTETDTGLVTFQLNSMCSKGLADASHFVEVMSSTEWLSEALKLGTSGFRAKFEHVEQEIMIKCANKIITGLNGKENTLFKKFNYDMAVEVSQSLHSIGTIEEIYGNPAKIHALARVVQGNAEDIFSELERILEKEDMLGEDAVVTDRDSVQSSADRGGNGPAVAYQEPRRSTESSRGGGLVRLLCCCCFRSKRAAKPTMRRKSYKFSSSSSGSGLEQKLLNNRSSGDRSL